MIWVDGSHELIHVSLASLYFKNFFFVKRGAAEKVTVDNSSSELRGLHNSGAHLYFKCPL